MAASGEIKLFGVVIGRKTAASPPQDPFAFPRYRVLLISGPLRFKLAPLNSSTSYPLPPPSAGTDSGCSSIASCNSSGDYHSTATSKRRRSSHFHKPKASRSAAMTEAEAQQERWRRKKMKLSPPPDAFSSNTALELLETSSIMALLTTLPPLLMCFLRRLLCV